MRGHVARALWSLSALLLLGLGAGLWIQPAGPGRLPGASDGAPQQLAVGDREPWSVLLISDLQAGVGYLGEIFRRAAPLRPKAVLIAGDLSRASDTADLGMVARELEAHLPPAPIFAVPGNHDVDDPRVYPAFARWFGGTDFDLTLGQTRFLGADDAEGFVPPADLQRLRERIADAQARQQHVVLVVHRPPLGTPECGTDIPGLAELVRESHLAAVLSGHCHRPSVETRGGTLFIVTPESGDTGTDERRQVVSYLMLRWNGTSFAVEMHAFERSWWTDLEGELLHVAQTYVRPRLAVSQPVLRAVLLAALALVLGSGWLCWRPRLPVLRGPRPDARAVKARPGLSAARR